MADIIGKLVRKYPRLCSEFAESKIKYDLEAKSSQWVIKLMEDCYNDAFVACSKEVSKTRRRKRCGLELGALDAFPLVMQRLIARVYSVLDLRPKVCLEFLLALELAIDTGDVTNNNKQLRDGNTAEDVIRRCLIEGNSNICINSDRALIFSKFLTEEWDVDYLAIFLYHRELIQQTFNFSLKELVVTRIIGGLDEEIMSTKDNEVKIHMGKVKQAPMTTPIPNHIKLVYDYTFSESPVPALAIERLPYLLQQLFPTIQPMQRNYVSEKILSKCSWHKSLTIKRVMAMPVAEALEVTPSMRELEEREVINKMIATCMQSEGNIVCDGVIVIPVYFILMVLIEEWSLIPPESKENISEVGKASELSLKELNEIYNNNCELMQTMQRKGIELEAELRNCEAELLKQEKLCRKLERRWSDNVATPDEIQKLQEIRVLITDIKAQK